LYLPAEQRKARANRMLTNGKREWPDDGQSGK